MPYKFEFGYARGLGFSRQANASGETVLRREDDGTVTIVRLAVPWIPTLVREVDGTVTVTRQ